MEIHSHTHTARKKLTHYLWEFLMLFLAVFCGFLAENKREHIVEHQREKKYINSMHNDLEADISRLTDIIGMRNERALLLDSLSNLLNSTEVFQRSGNLYYYNSFATRGTAFRFTPVDGTMQQLKNSGNLRLIQKQTISDSIMSYDVSTRAYVWGTNDEEEMIDAYRNVAEGVFDGFILIKMRDENNDVVRLDFNPTLRLTEDGKFRLNYRIHMLIAFNKTMRRLARNLLAKAQRLDDLLKKEYHLK